MEEDHPKFIIKYNPLDLNYISNIKISSEDEIISLEINDSYFIKKERILQDYGLFKKSDQIKKEIS